MCYQRLGLEHAECVCSVSGKEKRDVGRVRITLERGNWCEATEPYVAGPFPYKGLF